MNVYFKKKFSFFCLMFFVCTLLAGGSSVQNYKAASVSLEEADDQGQQEELEKGASVIKKPDLTVASKPGGSMKISWTKVDQASKYIIYRSQKKDSGFRKIYRTDGKKHSFIDTGLTVGNIYYYKLEVFSEGLEKRALGARWL